MAKVKSNNFKSQHGYSRVGGLLKSKDTKAELEKKQARLNSFSQSQNKQVADALERNNNAPEAIKKGAKLNEYGAYVGDQRYKKRRVKLALPKFRQ